MGLLGCRELLHQSRFGLSWGPLGSAKTGGMPHRDLGTVNSNFEKDRTP